MQITRIRIQNWRSIKDVDFYPSGICSVIGPNNAGKTNILSALNFVLGEKWPSLNTLQDGDFYNRDRSRDIKIEINFSGGNENINRIVFSSDGGRLQYGYAGNDALYPMNQVRREQFPLLYLDASRSYEATFSISQWSLFGRIIRALNDDFMANNGADIQERVKGFLRQAQDTLRTDLYGRIEESIKQAFSEQIRHTTHEVKFNFRTFDPVNLYKTLHPVVLENGIEKNPSEIGSGMRNLVVMALFRAYANVIRNGAIIAIEEPEIYLHPHAQRSLAKMFEEMNSNGNQIFFSTHSSSFVDASQPERIVLVERCLDGEEEMVTSVKTSTAEDLLTKRKELHPDTPITVESMRGRYKTQCSTEHSDGYFAKAIILVEGQTEVETLPIFAQGCGVDLDALGISVIQSRGKTSLDAYYQLYKAHEIPVFVVFDNDSNKTGKDREWNKVLTRMLGLSETDDPAHQVGTNYAVDLPPAN